MTDVALLDQGSLIGFQPVSDAAQEWFADNVASEDWQWFGPVLWVEHRLARELAIAVEAAGLRVEAQR
jgi:hypothetical protein